MIIHYVQDTVLGCGDTTVIKKDVILIYMEFTFWQSQEWRQIINKNQIKYILYQMVISARENSKTRWWGNGISARRELLFEIRLAERLPGWGRREQAVHINWCKNASDRAKIKCSLLSTFRGGKEAGRLEWTGWEKNGRTEVRWLRVGSRSPRP